jgi:hypothetical protein
MKNLFYETNLNIVIKADTTSGKSHDPEQILLVQKKQSHSMAMSVMTNVILDAAGTETDMVQLAK